MSMSNHTFNRFVKSLSATTGASKVTVAVLLAAVAAVAGLGMQQAQAAEIPKDCSTNSVIECGVTSADDFIAKVKANKPKDLQAIYARYGLTPANYDKFAKDAKVGIAKTNGEIIVDGKVVMYRAASLGRHEKSYSLPDKIGNTTYYVSSTSDVLTKDQPVLVEFNGTAGSASQLVLMSCGNPVYGVPTFKCDQLKAKAVSGKENTYEFSTDVPMPQTVKDKLAKVVYTFDDGTKEVVRTSVDATVTHTFAKPGTYKVKSTVYIKLRNGKEVVINGAGCIKEITIKAEQKPQKAEVQKTAAAQCTALKATAKSTKENEYVYALRANAKMTNVTLVSGNFDFGDGTTQQLVKPATANDDFIEVEHTYKAAGTYHAKTTLTFKVDKDALADSDKVNVTTVVCETTITIKQQAKPAAAAPAATPPAVLGKAITELPATGPAGLAGLFAGSATLGTAGYRWHARRRVNKVDDLIDRLRRQ